jgi:hypothetical protein
MCRLNRTSRLFLPRRAPRSFVGMQRVARVGGHTLALAVARVPRFSLNSQSSSYFIAFRPQRMHSIRLNCISHGNNLLPSNAGRRLHMPPSTPSLCCANT